MAYTIKPSGSTQYIGSSKQTTNSGLVGLQLVGYYYKYRMRYSFTVPVQMTKLTVVFQLDNAIQGKMSVGLTTSSGDEIVSDTTVTADSSNRVTATYTRTLIPGTTYYLWLGYSGSNYETARCFAENVTITATAAASTLAVKDGTLGAAQTLTINRADTAFTHTIQYTVGSISGTIATKTSAGNVNWTPPLSLAAQNTTSKTISCKLTLTTYSGSTAVGTSETTISLTIPASTAPTVTAAYEPESDLPSAFDGIYVQGKSKVKADYSAAGQHGASIKNYVTTVNGKATTHTAASFTSEVITGSGSVSVAVKATDSRGYSTTKTETITVQPYEAPAVIPASGQTAIVCARATADGVLNDSGTYLRVRAGKRFSSVSGKNECLLRYRYAAEGESYGAWSALLDKGSSANEISTTLNLNLNPTKAYKVEIGVSDDVGSASAITFSISTQDVPLHLGNGGKNVALGRYCDYSSEKRIDIGWDVYLSKGARIHPPEGETVEFLKGMGAVIITKLWENASPTSSFAGQTIAVDLSGYDFYMVTAVASTTSQYVISTIVPAGNGGLLSYAWGDSGAAVHRSFVRVANGIQFYGAYFNKNGSTEHIMPFQIYGIKGVK